MGDLDGRVAIVTGAAQGIGFGCCEELVQAGAQVVVADIVAGAAAAAAAELGENAVAMTHDVRSAASSDALVEAVLQRFGHLDILVNNAGVGSRPARIQDTTENEYDRVMDVNVRGVFLVSRAATPALLESATGRIINVSSVLGQTGKAMVLPYSAAKHAVMGITQSLAAELAPHGVTVNAVCPGIVETELHKRVVAGLAPLQDQSEEGSWDWFRSMIPLGRFQTSRDVGAVVAFLASDRARNITGAAFNVDGGSEMH